jgi:hypothetical protein
VLKDKTTFEFVSLMVSDGWLLIQQHVGLCPLAQCHIVAFWGAGIFVDFLPAQVWSQKRTKYHIREEREVK